MQNMIEKNLSRYKQEGSEKNKAKSTLPNDYRKTPAAHIKKASIPPIQKIAEEKKRAPMCQQVIENEQTSTNLNSKKQINFQNTKNHENDQFKNEQNAIKSDQFVLSKNLKKKDKIPSSHAQTSSKSKNYSSKVQISSPTNITKNKCLSVSPKISNYNKIGKSLEKNKRNIDENKLIPKNYTSAEFVRVNFEIKMIKKRNEKSFRKIEEFGKLYPSILNMKKEKEIKERNFKVAEKNSKNSGLSRLNSGKIQSDKKPLFYITQRSISKTSKTDNKPTAQKEGIKSEAKKGLSTNLAKEIQNVDKLKFIFKKSPENEKPRIENSKKEANENQKVHVENDIKREIENHQNRINSFKTLPSQQNRNQDCNNGVQKKTNQWREIFQKKNVDCLLEKSKSPHQISKESSANLHIHSPMNRRTTFHPSNDQKAKKTLRVISEELKINNKKYSQKKNPNDENSKKIKNQTVGQHNITFGDNKEKPELIKKVFQKNLFFQKQISSNSSNKEACEDSQDLEQKKHFLSNKSPINLNPHKSNELTTSASKNSKVKNGTDKLLKNKISNNFCFSIDKRKKVIDCFKNSMSKQKKNKEIIRKITSVIILKGKKEKRQRKIDKMELFERKTKSQPKELRNYSVLKIEKRKSNRCLEENLNFLKSKVKRKRDVINTEILKQKKEKKENCILNLKGFKREKKEKKREIRDLIIYVKRQIEKTRVVKNSFHKCQRKIEKINNFSNVGIYKRAKIEERRTTSNVYNFHYQKQKKCQNDLHSQDIYKKEKKEGTRECRKNYSMDQKNKKKRMNYLWNCNIYKQEKKKEIRENESNYTLFQKKNEERKNHVWNCHIFKQEKEKEIRENKSNYNFIQKKNEERKNHVWNCNIFKQEKEKEIRENKSNYNFIQKKNEERKNHVWNCNIFKQEKEKEIRENKSNYNFIQKKNEERKNYVWNCNIFKQEKEKEIRENKSNYNFIQKKNEERKNHVWNCNIFKQEKEKEIRENKSNYNFIQKKNEERKNHVWNCNIFKQEKEKEIRENKSNYNFIQKKNEERKNHVWNCNIFKQEKEKEIRENKSNYNFIQKKNEERKNHVWNCNIFKQEKEKEIRENKSNYNFIQKKNEERKNHVWNCNIFKQEKEKEIRENKSNYNFIQKKNKKNEKDFDNFEILKIENGKKILEYEQSYVFKQQVKKKKLKFDKKVGKIEQERKEFNDYKILSNGKRIPERKREDFKIYNNKKKQKSSLSMQSFNYYKGTKDEGVIGRVPLMEVRKCSLEKWSARSDSGHSDESWADFKEVGEIAERPKEGLGMKETFRNMVGRAVYAGYQIMKSSKRVTKKQVKESKTVALLGKTFGSANEEMEALLDNIFKFTYVQNIVWDGRWTSDVGWGCTIRTGQMVLANLFLFKTSAKSKRQRLTDDWLSVDHKKRGEVFGLFRQGGPFYFSSLFDHGHRRLNNRSPGVFWSNLELLVVVQSMLGEMTAPPPLLTGLRFLNTTSYVSFPKLKKELESQAVLLFSCSVCLGIGGVDLSLEKSARYLMSMSNFAGLMAGEGRRSYYVFGCTEAYFLYLDPHEVIDGEDEDNESRHHTNSYFSIRFSSFNPFMTFLFAIDSESLATFEKQLTSPSNPGELISIMEEDSDINEEQIQQRLEEFNANSSLLYNSAPDDQH